MPLLAPGTSAPDFAITGHTGETVKLADYRGAYLLLFFYPRASTPGCTLEAQGFRDRLTELRTHGAAVLGASFDHAEDNRAFAAAHDLPFVLLCDTARDLALRYGAADDREAAAPRRISYLIAPDGTIARVFTEVSPADHAGEVLSHLAELAA